MKFLVLALCVSVATAAPQVRGAVKAYSGDEKIAEVLRSESDVQPNGYNYLYETANGITAQESGVLKKVTDVESIAAQGSYQYTSPEGQSIIVTYVADENGFQPSGDVLPTPPPTPDHVLRLLKFIEEHPPPVETVIAAKRNF